MELFGYDYREISEKINATKNILIHINYLSTIYRYVSSLFVNYSLIIYYTRYLRYSSIDIH